VPKENFVIFQAGGESGDEKSSHMGHRVPGGTLFAGGGMGSAGYLDLKTAVVHEAHEEKPRKPSWYPETAFKLFG
jgi:hypothetical protein